MKFQRKYQPQTVFAITVAIAGFFTFLLGFIGFQEAFSRDGNKNGLDYIYKTIQLFGLALELPDDKPIPLYLQIARFLALFVSFSAIGATLVRIFSSSVERFRLKLLQDHVVVCGLSNGNMLFIRELIERYPTVVIIEPDTGNQDLGECETLGCRIIRQSYNDPLVLESAGVTHASLVLILGTDDHINTETALFLRELITDQNMRIIRCVVQISDAATKQFLQRNHQTIEEKPRFDLEVISYKELLSMFMLSESQFFDPQKKNDHSTHRVVLGYSEYAEILIFRAILDWRMTQNRGEGRIKITVIGPVVGELVDRLRQEHQDLDNYCDFEIINLNYRSGAFRKGEWSKNLNIPELSSVQVVLDSDLNALEVAEIAAKFLSDLRFPIQVAMNQTGPISQLLERRGCFKVVALDSIASSVTLVLDSRIEIIAIALHYEYLRFMDNSQWTAWSELDNEFKDSCRRQAREISVKLKAINCIEKLVDPGEAKLMEFSEGEIELMARMEHDSWLDERKQKGWSFALTKDAVSKKTPNLVPWSELNEKYRELNRSTVRAIPYVLVRLDVQICRT